MKQNQSSEWIEASSGLETFLFLLMMDTSGYHLLQHSLTNFSSHKKRIHKLQHFLQFLPVYLPIVRKLQPDKYRYSPEIEALLRCLQIMPIEDDYWFATVCKYPQLPTLLNVLQFEKMRQFVSAFLKELRQCLLSGEVQNCIAQHSRSVETRYSAMMAYVDYLFVLKAQYGVLRVDLSYAKDTDVDCKKIKSDWNRMYENMRHNKLFEGIDGYIYKLEYGIEKGLHIHLLLFFSMKQCKDEDCADLAWQIGEYWKNTIVKVNGNYWNCHANLQQYENLGIVAIGAIRSSDTIKRANLANIVKYFCKYQQFIKPRDHPKMRLLTHGKYRSSKMPRIDSQ
jgi:hypothetical protein